MRRWITLLRHGESEANKAQVLQGQIDSPLSETGRLQALRVAESWIAAEAHFDHIVSSPLLRARQTAEIVAEVLGYQAEIEIDPVWKERSFGELEGMAFSHIQQLDPPVDYFQPFEPIGGEGESQLDLYLRAAQGLQKLVRNTPRRTLVVSHGAMIGKTLYAVLGITPQGHYHSPVFYLGECFLHQPELFE
jgi:broad specificity phosphatase PhoE